MGNPNIGPFNYCSLLSDIMSAIHEAGLLKHFDWPVWQDETERVCYKPRLIENTDLETNRNKLTLNQ